MDFKEYQKKAISTCTDTSKNISYMLYNLIAEIGEVFEKTNIHNLLEKRWIEKIQSYSELFSFQAKAIRKGEIKQTEIDIENPEELKKELGDVLWHLSGLCTVLGFDLNDIAEININKLQDRQNRGVIVGSGDNR